ncbi:MAG: hypothetical protein K2M76_08125, partial [Muribaculaceae bacterium]|nr:hypothetical protein [Muribaculaceae bacterium]
MLRKLLVATAALAMTASAATTHRLATFNIRCYAVEDTEGRDWRYRGIKCAEAIKNYSFDIVGLQEVNGPGKGYYNPLTGRVPLEDMKAWLQEDYDWVTWDNLIVSRATMEYECICYKRARYEVLETGSFYISPTPDVHSQGWDPAIQSYHRLVGWAKMKDRQSGETLVFATTHTNNGRSLDGPYGSQLVSERVKKVAGDLPVVVVADYNMSRTLAYDQMAQKAYHASFYDAAEECPSETNYSVPIGPRNAI